jgi:hypothetical protein
VDKALVLLQHLQSTAVAVQVKLINPLAVTQALRSMTNIAVVQDLQLPPLQTLRQVVAVEQGQSVVRHLLELVEMAEQVEHLQLLELP